MWAWGRPRLSSGKGDLHRSRPRGADGRTVGRQVRIRRRGISLDLAKGSLVFEVPGRLSQPLYIWVRRTLFTGVVKTLNILREDLYGSLRGLGRPPRSFRS